MSTTETVYKVCRPWEQTGTNYKKYRNTSVNSLKAVITLRQRHNMDFLIWDGKQLDVESPLPKLKWSVACPLSTPNLCSPPHLSPHCSSPSDSSPLFSECFPKLPHLTSMERYSMAPHCFEDMDHYLVSTQDLLRSGLTTSPDLPPINPLFPTHVFFFFFHMCIQCLGHFSPHPHPLPYYPSRPLLLPLPPQYPAETILPLSLILLKREYKQ
jgi:hypothetical protein